MGSLEELPSVVIQVFFKFGETLPELLIGNEQGDLRNLNGFNFCKTTTIYCMNFENLILAENQLYNLYEILVLVKQNLDSKINKSDDDFVKLSSAKSQLKKIDELAREKMDAEPHWSKEDIMLSYGPRPSVILTFYPGSESYKKFGKSVVAKITFTDKELEKVVENITLKRKPTAGLLNFKIPSADSDKILSGSIGTKDIFEIAGRCI